MTFRHETCDCSYAFICPWDRYCAGCGKSLVEPTPGRSLVSVQQAVKVGQASRVQFIVMNQSRVVIHVEVPDIRSGQANARPEWFKVDPSTGNRREEALEPGATASFEYDIDADLVRTLLQGDRRNFDVSYRLPFYVDVDYLRQSRQVLFALTAQADLSPVAVEVKYLRLDTRRSLQLPLKIRTSGEDMQIGNVRAIARSADMQDVVDALFPPSKLVERRNTPLPGGGLVEIPIESGVVAECLETIQKPRVSDNYAHKRQYWFEKSWPASLIVEFDIEVSLSTTGDAVSPVRTYVCLELVRPPLLRDATPEDGLWCAVDPELAELPDDLPGAFNGSYALNDRGIMDFAAGLTNESAVPIRVDSVQSSVSWLTLHKTRTNVVVEPGGSYVVRASVDMSRREARELSAQVLTAAVVLGTTPPLPEQIARLEVLKVECASVETLPGCLGIDFGTSNCAVCYMPGHPSEGASDAERLPLPIPLEAGTPNGLFVAGASNVLFGELNLPSVITRRRTRAIDAADPEFAFGKAAEDLEPVTEPGNVVRGLKRMLSQQTQFSYNFDIDKGNDEYSPQEVAERLLCHIVRQTERRGRDVPELVARVGDAILVDGDSHPVQEQLRSALTYRFTRAVFTHPVDASEGMKRVLYAAAVKSGLAAHPTGATMTYAEFAAERLVDEASAAVGQFAYEYRKWLTALARKVPANGQRVTLVCLDVGGGTTDISVMRHYPFKKQENLELLFRKGINDFAGMDLDRAIVLDFIARATEQLGSKGLHLSFFAKQVDMLLKGYGRRLIQEDLKRLLGIAVDEARAKEILRGIDALTSALRGRAEEIKKEVGSTPTGTSTVAFPIQAFVLDGATQRLNTLGDAADTATFDIIVPHTEVTQILTAQVQPRLRELDLAVRNAQIGWHDVDVLMFTGQTCRSPALRAAVLEHVRMQRGGTLPAIVAPSKEHAPPGVNVQVFDPKTCVAAGAALKGVGLNKMSLSVGQKLGVQISDFDNEHRLTPDVAIPACMPLIAMESDNGDGAVISWRIDRKMQPEFPAHAGANPGDAFLIFVTAERRVWVARTGAAGEQPFPEAPPALATLVAGMTDERRATLLVNGPVVTWAAQMHELPPV